MTRRSPVGQGAIGISTPEQPDDERGDGVAAAVTVRREQEVGRPPTGPVRSLRARGG
jgi:hypothetical protein